MAEDSLCPRMGTDDEHVRRTTLGRSNSWLPTVLHDGNEPTLLQRRSIRPYRLRNSRRHNALVLGQRSMVDGEPVQLGQASRPIRDIHHITRSDKRDTSRHVAGRHTRDCPFCSNGCCGWMVRLSSSDKPGLAHRHRNFCHNSSLALRPWNDIILVVPRLWPRSRIIQRSPPGTGATTFRSILPRLLPSYPVGRSGGCLRYPSNYR